MVSEVNSKSSDMCYETFLPDKIIVFEVSWLITKTSKVSKNSHFFAILKDFRNNKNFDVIKLNEQRTYRRLQCLAIPFMNFRFFKKLYKETQNSR